MNLKMILIAAAVAGSAIFVSGCASTGHEQSTGEVIDDAAITAKVKAALLNAKDVNSLDIQVKTFNGTVQLAGFVDSEWQINKAAQVASTVVGVQHIKNDLIHKPN